MTAESNADIARRFLQSFWDGHVEKGIALCAPDARWTFQKSLRAPRYATIREAVDWLNDALVSGFAPDSGYEVTVHNVIADGGEVAMEYTARGGTRSGGIYENNYLVRFTIEDGLIRSVRPYFDTLYVHRRLAELPENSTE
jgi:ketosteroid isomerase-like protein